MADFEALCKRIIDTNGKPSTQDVLDCGYSVEHSLRITQSNTNPERLVKNARECLKARGLYYNGGA